ncbi:transcriptional regulator GlxA family with amidase domain [Pelomonas saccharophila]|uniref:Transcriptional regulator GlxA family with amidase domain n=1 Tax=Roseateles saccharophilus TaxID=304 RepID=A0ABU1YLZ8_ROSSA|nr:helix-turn-helix domain-containing protein [Roseateles saccharophilus]MDR7269881.1 transcriptional regulator GlxA family with amidase domain [Roseateles saccharophilus]
MKMDVLALGGVFDTGLAAVLDTLATANELAAAQGWPAPPFDVRVVGLRRRVQTALGLQVPVQAADGRAADWLVLPAIGTKMPPALVAALATREVRDAAAHLRDRHAACTRIAAACIGGFVLAESGLLDGHEATVSWWLGPLFRERYPAVRLDESRMLVASGDFVTTGAAIAHMDLALWLVRQASPELAAVTARYLIVDPRPSQAPYVIPDHLAHSDPLVGRFERWAREHLAQGFSLAAAADALATSPRTLQRRLEAVLGKSPLAYVQDLRVQHAVHLLQTSRSDVEAIAAQVGYADAVTLRALLRRKLGRGVKELRAR